MYIIKVDGVEYIMGTRVPITKVREIMADPSLDTDGQPDVVGEIVDFAQKEGYGIARSLAEEVIKEATSKSDWGRSSPPVTAGK